MHAPVTTVRDTLRRGGWTVEVLATAAAGDARRFAREAHAQGFDALVCYGGRHGHRRSPPARWGAAPPLGLVPGWHRGTCSPVNLRLPRDPAAAARVILAAAPRPSDLGSVERADATHYFAVCSGTGFDARLMAAPGRPRNGAEDGART